MEIGLKTAKISLSLFKKMNVILKDSRKLQLGLGLNVFIWAILNQKSELLLTCDLGQCKGHFL